MSRLCRRCSHRPWECTCSRRKKARFDSHADGTPFLPADVYQHRAHPYFVDNTPGQ